MKALKGMLQGKLLKDLQYQEFEKTFNKICFNLDANNKIEDNMHKMIDEDSVIINIQQLLVKSMKTFKDK